ncbi:MAG TPA: hypothetical protein VF678_04195 [bacterium]
MDWKDTVRGMAPAIGAALGGPAAGAAVAFLGERLLGKPGAAEAEVAAAVQSLMGDQRLILKPLEPAFTLRMRELGVDLERLNAQHAQTGASARERQVVTGDRTPQALAYIYTGGFFAVLALQFALVFMDRKIPEQVLRTLDISTGVLFAFVMASKDYFLGSSSGSKRKTEMMANGNGNGNGNGH